MINLAHSWVRAADGVRALKPACPADAPHQITPKQRAAVAPPAAALQALPLYKFKAGVRHQYISVCLPGRCKLSIPLDRTAAHQLLAHSISIDAGARCTGLVQIAAQQLQAASPLCRQPTSQTAPHPAADAGCTGLATFIVDPNFKDTLSVAHPTPRYAALLDSLPSAVVASKVRRGHWLWQQLGFLLPSVLLSQFPAARVGVAAAAAVCVCMLVLSTFFPPPLLLKPSRPPPPPTPPCLAQPCLHRAVSILSREMARSFADQGSDLPPWRTHQALLNKWHLGGVTASSSTADGAGCSAWATQGFPAAGQLFGGGKAGLPGPMGAD